MIIVGLVTKKFDFIIYILKYFDNTFFKTGKKIILNLSIRNKFDFGLL